VNHTGIRQPRIKICGIRTREAADAAVIAGVDALGFVFYPPSPRFIEPAAARSIIASLPPFVTAVGLVVNADTDALHSWVRESGVHMIQFHGQETPGSCQEAPLPWIKALQVREDLDVSSSIRQWEKAGASGVLLDAWHPHLYGGTGQAFDWRRVPAGLAGRVVLAGGLTPDNVQAAIRQTRPGAVDVSGGVESSRGVKSSALIKSFCQAVQQIENQDEQN
jgi:phosphoribosylanthranilate isomerase